MIQLTTTKRQFNLNFHEKHITMSFCELLALRSKLQQIDITEHFYSDQNSAGIEILSLCNLKHILILETLDVLELNRLVENIFHSQGVSLAL